MLELLNQLDGFDSRGDVKVIMATNRIESLDPALIRAGASSKTTLLYFKFISRFSSSKYINEKRLRYYYYLFSHC